MKVRRNVPGTIDLVFFVRPDFAPDVLHVIDASQYDRLECSPFLPMDIISSQLRKEIQEHLIIRSAVHLIDHQYNGFVCISAPVA